VALIWAVVSPEDVGFDGVVCESKAKTPPPTTTRRRSAIAIAMSMPGLLRGGGGGGEDGGKVYVSCNGTP